MSPFPQSNHTTPTDTQQRIIADQSRDEAWLNSSGLFCETTEHAASPVNFPYFEDESAFEDLNQNTICQESSISQSNVEEPPHLMSVVRYRNLAHKYGEVLRLC